jgi:hypothetical protein
MTGADFWPVDAWWASLKLGGPFRQAQNERAVNMEPLFCDIATGQNRLRNLQLGLTTWACLCEIWLRSLPFMKYINMLFP